MTETLTLILAVIACALLVVLLLRKPARPDLSELFPRLDALRDESRRLEQSLRDETARSVGGLRSELASQLEGFRLSLSQAHEKDRAELRAQLAEQQGFLRETLAAARAAQAAQLADFAQRLDALAAAVTAQLGELRASVDTRLAANAEATTQALSRTRSELADAATSARAEARSQAAEFQQKTAAKLDDSRAAQNTQLADFAARLGQLQTSTKQELELVRQALDTKLAELSAQNAAKLDEMRATVDERLKSTLEQRLGESFKMVGDNLDRVTKALGEMQQIATGVGDLKRVLTNVKTRGTWGEVQLAALLEQVLTRDQYEANVAPIPGSTARVEFAIKLPGQGDAKLPVWLPLDAKFPIEDYQRLSEAAERADSEAVAVASLALGNRVRDFAKTIAEKYISPPTPPISPCCFSPPKASTPRSSANPA